MPRLQPPENGVTVRMYRLGHGDCFLLAFPRDGGGDPVYVLIDCGFKPSSPKFLRDDELDNEQSIAAIVKHIGESTGHHLDLVVITHEHEDHVNGFMYGSTPLFAPFTVDEAWLAWTEDPADRLANRLRKDHDDRLLEIVAARKRLAAAGIDDEPAMRRIDALLASAVGSLGNVLSAADLLAASDPAKSRNKQAMKLIKDKAGAHRDVRYLSPGGEPLPLPGSRARAFTLGPPRRERLLLDEDSRSDEAFPRDAGHRFTFGEAVAAGGEDLLPLFSRRFAIPIEDALRRQRSFFKLHYGGDDDGYDDSDAAEALDDAAWRRITGDWLFSAETLALKLSDGINNTSLVLAFELPESRKVLLFVGDAQRGNWFSWKNVAWQDGEQTVTARDLLARTVLYKVGHHGSHNATLAGDLGDEYANLSWIGTAVHREFTAMIPAVSAWASTQGWVHPLPSIKDALLDKAEGRVFQTDVDEPTQPDGIPDETWQAFLGRCTFDPRFFDYHVLDT